MQLYFSYGDSEEVDNARGVSQSAISAARGAGKWNAAQSEYGIFALGTAANRRLKALNTFSLTPITQSRETYLIQMELITGYIP